MLDLLSQIERGDITSQLPSESQLRERYSASRPTVRTALEKLASDGRIYPVHGVGWFVQNDDRLAFPLLRLDRGRAMAIKDVWQTWLDAEGLQGSAELKVWVDRPPRHVRQHLGLEPPEECAVRERVRRIEGAPVMISTAYFPMWLASGTELARIGEGDAVDMQNPSPVALLHQMGRGPASDEDQIGARRPTADEAKRLQIPPGGTVITVCRTSRDKSGARIRCTADVISGTRFYLIIDQTY